MNVASYDQGTADSADVDTAIAAAWVEVLADGGMRAKAAAALGIAEDALPQDAPFEARSRGAGLTGQGLDILWHFAGGFAGAVAYDLAKDEAKKAARATGRLLWDIVKPRATRRMDMGALGAEVAVRDDVQ